MNKKRILVIEDDDGISCLACKRLKSRGYEVYKVSSGHEAIKFLQDNSVELILLDFVLPDMTGQELIDELIKIERDFPFIVTTGQGDEKIAVEFMKRGAYDYIVKDDNFWDLLPTAVDRIVQLIETSKRLEGTEKALKESELRFQELAKSLPQTVFELDKNHMFTFVNEGALKMFKYSRKEMYGKMSLLDLIHKDDKERARSILKVWEQGDTSEGEEFVAESKDGNLYPVLIYANAIIKLETEEGLRGVIFDITEQKEMQKELRDARDKLEIRVQERTRELRDANHALEESLDKLKQAQEQLVESEKLAALGGLVAGVAHEINTPVGIGVTAASLLQQKMHEMSKLYNDEKLTRKNFEYLINIAVESSYMILTNLSRAGELIQSFKQVAVDQSSEEKRSFNLKQYIEEVLMSLQPKMKQTKHEIVINCPQDIHVYSYPGAFSQILTNFIFNSLLHGFENIEKGKISINVIVENDFIVLTYEDNGNGIPEANLKRIFDPFFTTKLGQGGSGLGLHVVYNLVKNTLNGKITCKSKSNVGTTFIIEVPYKKEGFLYSL